MLSGQYNFHGIRNNAVAFVRDGGKLETFDKHPYYLAYYPGCWVVQSSERYDDNEDSFWIKNVTKG